MWVGGVVHAVGFPDCHLVVCGDASIGAVLMLLVLVFVLVVGWWFENWIVDASR